MHTVRVRLDAWRDAARRRDTLTENSIGWQDADDEVREAANAFHAEVLRAAARYAGEKVGDEDAASSEFDRPDVRATAEGD